MLVEIGQFNEFRQFSSYTKMAVCCVWVAVCVQSALLAALRQQLSHRHITWIKFYTFKRYKHSTLKKSLTLTKHIGLIDNQEQNKIKDM